MKKQLMTIDIFFIHFNSDKRIFMGYFKYEQKNIVSRNVGANL